MGGPEHVPLLFPMLEKLAAEEDDQIREAAVQSHLWLLDKRCDIGAVFERNPCRSSPSSNWHPSASSLMPS